MVAVKVVVVLAISVTLDKKLLTVEDCHLVTDPTLFFRSSFVLLPPEHTVALPSIEPPTEAEFTVTVTAVLLDDGQAVAVQEMTT